MGEILPHCIFKNGSQFTITDTIRSKKVPPSSVCFMIGQKAHISRIPNMALFEIFVMKRGKKGKVRADKEVIVSPIFPIEIERRPLKREKIDSFQIAEISSVPDWGRDLSSLSELEFIGWAAARYSKLIKPLRETPEGDKLYRGMRNNHKYNNLMKLRDINIRMASNPEETMNEYKSKETRFDILELLRQVEVRIPHRVSKMNISDGISLLTALTYLIWSNRVKGGKLYNEEKLLKSYNFYRNEVLSLMEELYDFRKRRYDALTANIRKVSEAPPAIRHPRVSEDMLTSVKEYVEAEMSPPFVKIAMPNGDNGVEPWMFKSNYGGKAGMLFPEGE